MHESAGTIGLEISQLDRLAQRLGLGGDSLVAWHNLIQLRVIGSCHVQLAEHAPRAGAAVQRLDVSGLKAKPSVRLCDRLLRTAHPQQD